jgi:hypothetical protein
MAASRHRFHKNDRFKYEKSDVLELVLVPKEREIT